MAITSPDSLRTPDLGDPYNVITDMQVLAQDVQGAFNRRSKAIASGSVSVATVANSVVSTTVNFPAGRFSSAPKVTVTPVSAAVQVLSGGCGASSITTSSFSLNAGRGTGSGAVTYNWTAIES